MDFEKARQQQVIIDRVVTDFKEGKIDQEQVIAKIAELSDLAQYQVYKALGWNEEEMKSLLEPEEVRLLFDIDEFGGDGEPFSVFFSKFLALLKRYPTNVDLLSYAARIVQPDEDEDMSSEDVSLEDEKVNFEDIPLETFERAARLLPRIERKIAALQYLLQVSWRNKDAAQMRRYMDLANELCPGTPISRNFELAYSSLCKMDGSKASDELKTIPERPNSIEQLYRRAELLFLVGRYREALDAFESVMEWNKEFQPKEVRQYLSRVHKSLAEEYCR